ncbi:MAG: alpha/beta fold hydrolase [Candidatus Limnocylindria bacterium]
MDIQQLRSWIFELYEPLDDQRQYIVYDAARGNLMIDAPPFTGRALRLIRGTGPASVLVVTNRGRAADAGRYRDELGVQVAMHQDDADAVPGGADIVLDDEGRLRPDARLIRIRDDGQGASVVMLAKVGGVLVCGDLDLANPAARQLFRQQFSSVLSAGRPPMWSAGKDELLRVQRELPQAPKRFGILLQAPWDRAYKGRLDDQMARNPIVPTDTTSPREAAMGPATLIVASASRDAMAKPRRPVWEQQTPVPPPAPDAASPTGATAVLAAPAAALKSAADAVARVAGAAAKGASPPAPPARRRPRNFDEDWSAPSTPQPPTTLPNPEGTLAAPTRPGIRSLGARFTTLDLAAVVGAPVVDHYWGGIDLSPDGSEVAFAWDRGGTFEIYSAPLTGDRIFQLTEAGERSVSPRWSPDSSQVAFLRDNGGDENFDVVLVDRDGAGERVLAHQAARLHRDIAWSPDGRLIACVTNAGGKGFGIDVLDARTGKRTALTDGAYEDARPRWSPDGSWILFSSRRDKVRTNADLFVVPAVGGSPRLFETRGGAAGESRDGAWSPDGRRIAFTCTTGGRAQIAFADIQGGAVTRVDRPFDTPFDDTEPVWVADGRAVLYLRNHGEQHSIRRMFVVSHVDDPAEDRAGVHRSQHIAADSATRAFLFTDERRPWDVWMRGEDDLEARAVTRSLPAGVDPDAFVDPLTVRYPGAGNEPIAALLYLPYAEATRGEELLPAVVYVHGGPASQHFRWWDPVPQILANNGYAVLAPNIRGSTGYGQAFEQANRRDWGGKDLEDVARAANWLAEQGIADERRIGIYGGSYGGFMTVLALGKMPDRFAAGVSVNGIVSWATMADRSRGDLREYLHRELGDPKADAGRLRDTSPLTHVDSIRAPLLILQGANDPRVPASEAEQLVAALRAADKTFSYHVYEGEGHGFRRPQTRIDAVTRTLEWFDDFLR